MSEKHMGMDDRIRIEISLKQAESLETIAERIGKSNYLTRKQKKHAIERDKRSSHRIENRCVKREECQAACVCPEIICANEKKQTRCRLSHRCNDKCSNFEEERCEKHEKAAYVCNSCEDERSCELRKGLYIAKVAQQQYEDCLSESRNGANISEEELQVLDEFISPLLRKGQSIHPILTAKPNEIHISEKYREPSFSSQKP